MFKKFFITILITVLLLTVVGVLLHNVLAPQTKQITAEEAEKLCYAVMGEQDEATGFPFSFGVTGTIEQDGKEYYAIRASWLVNNSHMSYIGDFFVTTDGKEVYTGFVQAGEYIIEELIWSE